MELVTDILAIFGWAGVGAIIPCTSIFKFDDETKDGEIASKTLAISFGLIAASLVLG